MTTLQIDYEQLAEAYAEDRRCVPELVVALRDGGGVGWESRVLELGCGTGDYAIALQRLTGAFCTALDPSEAMLAVGRRASSPVCFVRGFAERLPFDDGRFDFVYAVDVVHHVADLRRTFREAGRVLAPGGKLCVATDDESTIRARVPLAQYFPETVPVELGRYRPLPELHAALEEAGLGGPEEVQLERPYLVTDIGPYRRKVFSCLHLIPEEAFARGLDRLERDLAEGPVRAVARTVLLFATKPYGAASRNDPPGTGGS